jgi:hypothetical protein
VLAARRLSTHDDKDKGFLLFERLCSSPFPNSQMDPQNSHNYAQPSLSPTNFFNGLELTPAIQPPGPRSYKSRKYRPCDFCRARQVACKIDIHPPCQLCSSHGRQCTFVERPKKKRRPNAPNGEASGSGSSGALCRGGRSQHHDCRSAY